MSTSSVVATSLLVLVIGCSSLLGLDETVGDRDGDGVADENDNCPDVANADQFDSDGDRTGDVCASCLVPIGQDFDGDTYDDACDRCLGPGPIGEDTDGDMIDDGCDACIAGVPRFPGDFDVPADGIADACQLCLKDGTGADVDVDGLDDACDACLRGPPHDEDGDGHEDSCDNCPTDDNADQQLGENTEIGRVCATLSPHHGRMRYVGFFDPFLRDRSAWEPDDQPWVVKDDTATLSIDAVRTYTAVEQLDTYVVSTRVRLIENQDMRVAVVATSFDRERLECVVDSSGGVELVATDSLGNVMTTKAGATISITEPFRIELVGRPAAGPVAASALCAAIDSSGRVETSPLGATPPNGGWRMGVSLQKAIVALEYFQILSAIAPPGSV